MSQHNTDINSLAWLPMAQSGLELGGFIQIHRRLEATLEKGQQLTV